MANNNALGQIKELIKALEMEMSEVSRAGGAGELLREHTHTCTHTCTGASCMCARGLGEAVINPQTPGAGRG